MKNTKAIVECWIGNLCRAYKFYKSQVNSLDDYEIDGRELMHCMGTDKGVMLYNCIEYIAEILEIELTVEKHRTDDEAGSDLILWFMWDGIKVYELK